MAIIAYITNGVPFSNLIFSFYLMVYLMCLLWIAISSNHLYVVVQIHFSHFGIKCQVLLRIALYKTASALIWSWYDLSFKLKSTSRTYSKSGRSCISASHPHTQTGWREITRLDESPDDYKSGTFTWIHLSNRKRETCLSVTTTRDELKFPARLESV